jgi:hypothetical protein
MRPRLSCAGLNRTITSYAQAQPTVKPGAACPRIALTDSMLRRRPMPFAKRTVNSSPRLWIADSRLARHQAPAPRRLSGRELPRVRHATYTCCGKTC